jgi:hypothetical protein
VGGVRDGDAGQSGRRVRCWCGGHGLTAPVADGFDGCGVGAGFVPSRGACAFAPEASGESAGHEDDTRATFPTAGTLGEFTRGRIFRVTGFAVSPMAAVDVQRHATDSGSIARYYPTKMAKFGQISAFVSVLMWRAVWDDFRNWCLTSTRG